MIAEISSCRPLKRADPVWLAAVLALAEKVARSRNAGEDDVALMTYGTLDPIDWSIAAVGALTAKP
jgi:hypothetical protein